MSLESSTHNNAQAEQLAFDTYSQQGGELGQTALTEKELSKVYQNTPKSSVLEGFFSNMDLDFKLPQSTEEAKGATETLRGRGSLEITQAWLANQNEPEPEEQIFQPQKYGRHEVLDSKDALFQLNKIRELPVDSLVLPQNRPLLEKVYSRYDSLLAEIKRLERLQTSRASYEAKVIETTLSRVIQVLKSSDYEQSEVVSPEPQGVWSRAKQGMGTAVNKIKSWFSRK